MSDTDKELVVLAVKRLFDKIKQGHVQFTSTVPQTLAEVKAARSACSPQSPSSAWSVLSIFVARTACGLLRSLNRDLTANESLAIIRTLRPRIVSRAGWANRRWHSGVFWLCVGLSRAELQCLSDCSGLVEMVSL
jgi:hypothetical protein